MAILNGMLPRGPGLFVYFLYIFIHINPILQLCKWEVTGDEGTEMQKNGTLLRWGFCELNHWKSCECRGVFIGRCVHGNSCFWVSVRKNNHRKSTWNDTGKLDLDCNFPFHAHKHFMQPSSRTEVVCFSLLSFFSPGPIDIRTGRWLAFFPPQNRYIVFPTPSPTGSHQDIPISGRRLQVNHTGACSRGMNKWLEFLWKIDRTTQISCNSRWACL